MSLWTPLQQRHPWLLLEFCLAAVLCWCQVQPRPHQAPFQQQASTTTHSPENSPRGQTHTLLVACRAFKHFEGGLQGPKTNLIPSSASNTPY